MKKKLLNSLTLFFILTSGVFIYAQNDETLSEPGVPPQEVSPEGVSVQEVPAQESAAQATPTPTAPGPAVSSPIASPAQDNSSVMPPAGGQAQIQASGANKISLDLKGMDVTEVLKMLAQRAGINIVMGKDVTGKVTILLRDVDVRDAFEIVILASDLAYEKKGNIINIMNQRDYEMIYGESFQDKKQAKIFQLKYAKAADVARSLNQIRTNVGKIVPDETSNMLVVMEAPETLKKMEDFVKSIDIPMQTRIFNLEYTAADKLSTKLGEMVTKGVGSFKIDERTNKVAISDYPEKLDEIAKIIQAFDEKTPQVLIDAQIIQLSPSDKFEMGINWDYWIKKYFEFKTNLPINTDNALIIGTHNTTVSEKGDYKAIMDILRTIGDTKTLASPRVMVVNNQEAKIHVGTKEAYITSTTSQSGTGTSVTSQTVNFVDTGITLHVTPTVNRENFITLKIKPEISDATRVDLLSEGQKTSIPIVTSSDAETTVMVKDGVTVIIGGLTKDKKDKTVKKIPLLGDIPFLGFAFRSTSDNVTKSDLVILLTPHVMSGETSFSSFDEIKPKDGVVKKWRRGKIVEEKFSRPPEEVNKEYYNLITNKIKELLFFSQPKELQGMFEVGFILLSSGELKSEPEIISSDNKAFNELVVASIKNAAPFPPFPKDSGKKEEEFRITLDYR